MPIIKAHFQGQDPIVMALEDSRTSELYLRVLERNLESEPPRWRDPMKYDLEYFKILCLEIKDRLGWKWDMENFSTEQTVLFHKDIEDFLEKDQSFKNVPGEYQNLLHEAHYCIHAIQYRDPKLPRGAFLQLEWFNDDHEDLPEDKDFKHYLDFGDVLLQNPYVGHPPLQCWLNNDYRNIDRTCAYHDRIKPGIKINVYRHKGETLDVDKYKKWWVERCSSFTAKEGIDKILRYTGFPVIGKVVNQEQLEKIINIKQLQFERLEIS
jgi:hypothetical protein